jgi:hypothetical protein
MFLPTVQAVVERLLTPIGWGAVISGILGVSGWLVRKFIADIKEEASDMKEDLKAIRDNHLSHIEVSTAKTVTLLEAQNISLAGMTEAAKDTAVTLAEIKTLLSLK